MGVHYIFILILVLIGYYVWDMSKDITEEFVNLSQDYVTLTDQIATQLVSANRIEGFTNDPNSCGTVEIQPGRGNAPFGFYPDTKNCSVNQHITVTNRYPGLSQQVTCAKPVPSPEEGCVTAGNPCTATTTCCGSCGTNSPSTCQPPKTNHIEQVIINPGDNWQQTSGYPEGTWICQMPVDNDPTQPPKQLRIVVNDKDTPIYNVEPPFKQVGSSS
jgi:hypothetical protein